MHPFKKHYDEVVQRDMVLSESVPSASLLASPKKVLLSVGSNNCDEAQVISLLAALNIVAGHKPCVARQRATQQRNKSTREAVGGKVTLRRSAMHDFFYKLLSQALPSLGQFKGLKFPCHKNVYSFVLKDMFAFKELVPLFPYFEELGALQCQFHFTTKQKTEIVVLGNGLQLCFFPSEK